MMTAVRLSGVKLDWKDLGREPIYIAFVEFHVFNFDEVLTITYTYDAL
jgi:hypothetical protein